MIKWRRWLSLGAAACLTAGCAAPPQPSVAPLPKPVEVTEEAFDASALPTDPELQAYVMVGNVPVYLIGPGDLLEITLREADVSFEDVLVRPDGNISFSLVENLRAQGLTVTQLDSALTSELRSYLRDPKIDIQITEYRSKLVSVLGAILSINTAGKQTGQGRYPLRTRTTALDIILAAGGTTQDAQLDKVQLIRGGRPYTLNLQRALSTGDQSYNVILQAEDMIVVPGSGQLNKKVVVLGEVAHPNVYMFPEDAYLLDAMSRAGGLAATALRDDIRVIRATSSGPKMFTVNFDRITRHLDLAQNMLLFNNDIVFVPRSFVGDVNEALAKISPVLDILMVPASFRDLYTTGGGLRVDTGNPPEASAGTVFTRALPGAAAKAVVPPEEEVTEAEAETSAEEE